MTYGFDVRTNSIDEQIARLNIDKYAEDLLGHLASARSDDISERKICFVAHSLGGVVVANSLTLTLEDERLKRIQDHITGVVCLGVPLGGSDLATLGKFISNLTQFFFKSRSKKMLEILQPKSGKLEDVRIRFLTRLNSRGEGNKIRPAFFYESLEVLPGLMIVRNSSATTEGRNSLSIHAHHMNMTKFPNSSDSGYKLIKGELKEQIEHARSQDVARKRTDSNPTAPIIDNVGSNINGEVKSLKQQFIGGSSHDMSSATISFNENNYRCHGHFTSPTPRCVRLPKSVDDVVGSGEKLEEVHQMVGVSNLAVALVGLAGIGKSRLAIKFGNEYFEKSPNTWVFWVQAGSKAQLEMGYGRIAKSLEIAEYDAPNIMDLVTDYLSCTMQNKWLLIIDNVDDLSIISEGESERLKLDWLKKHLFSDKNGYILITTCNKKLANDLNTEVIDVFELRLEDARFLLKSKMRKRNNSDPEEDIDELLRKVDCIPLAIIQAAVFLNNNKRYPIKKYLEDLQSKGSSELMNHLDQEWRPNEGFEQRKPIIQTLHIQISHIWKEDKKDKKGQGAADLLSQMSFCDRQSISEIIFKDDPHFTENVRKLMDYSLVVEMEYVQEQTVGSLINKKEERTFAMHNLVQRATRAWLEIHEESEIQMNYLISKLRENIPLMNNYYNDFYQCQTLIPHVQEVFSIKQEDESSNVDWDYLLYHVAYFAKWNGDYRMGLKFIKKMLERCEDNSQRAILAAYGYYIQGTLLKESRLWGEAEISLQKAKQMKDEISLQKAKQLKEEDENFELNIRFELLRLYSDSEDATKVSKLQEEVEGRLFEDRECQLKNLRILAKSFEFQAIRDGGRDKWQEAENKWKELLEYAKELPDKDERHLWCELACLSLTECHWRQENFKAARDFLELQLHGSDKIDDITYALRNRLAEACYHLKKYEDAKEILRQISDPNNSRGSFFVKLAEYSLGFLCYEVPELQDSEKNSETVKKDSEEVIRCFHGRGKSDCFRLGAIHKAAISMKSEGRVDEAISMMKDCYEGREEIYESTDPILQDSLSLWKNWEEERDQHVQDPNHYVKPPEDDQEK